MRLLSFISDIERALRTGSRTPEGAAWEAHRMINFQHCLARLTLKARPGAETSISGGVIFVQAFALADGSLCVKASLNWTGSTDLPVIAVYDRPSVNWKQEAGRVATAWLKGPPTTGTVTTTDLSVTEIQAIAS
jgi:hypothetical protein